MRINIAGSYKRWRHGRGFGIHSPFAYGFIVHTLRERLPYYAYHRLDTLAESQRIGASGRRRLRLIFRIAVRFNPATAAIAGDRDGSLLKAALKAVRRDIDIKVPAADADLVIVNEDIHSLTSARDRAVYIFPDTRRGGAVTCDALWETTPRGMRFDNAHGFTIIVSSPRLPRQQFDVRF